MKVIWHFYNSWIIKISDVDVTVLPWFCVKHWTYEALQKRMIFVYIDDKLMDETITVVTDQVEYLADVVNQCFKTIQVDFCTSLTVIFIYHTLETTPF